VNQHSSPDTSSSLLVAALDYARHGMQVFPGRGKIPAIRNPHPRGSRERQECKGQCGRHGHGVLDATTDAATVTTWWGGRYCGANILGRVPRNVFVLDVDPRNGGLESLAALQDRHGPLPDTLTTISGRGDGGTHTFWRRPPGTLTTKRFDDGIDIKHRSGYVVLPPSIHPDTGEPYTRIDRLIAAPPAWLIKLITERPYDHPRTRVSSPHKAYSGSSASSFNENTSWADILVPHGWTCLEPDPDAVGATWLHPTHTSACSATIGRDHRLYVYSTNTVFDVTETGSPRGYSRFDAYALLNHGGDMRAAAQALKGTP
jgi:Bifunctional DNA primase/polymerase, N-terminal